MRMLLAGILLGVALVATARATVVPKQVVADVGAYVDAVAANADAANIDWLGDDPRQNDVTLAWAAIELNSALKQAGLPSHIYKPGTSNRKLPTITVAINPTLATGVQGYRISISDAGVLIEGKSRVGALYGSYRFLDRLGFRWYSATDKIVPADIPTTTIAWPAFTEEPAVRWRGFWVPLDGSTAVVPESYGIWMARNRLNLGGDMPLAQRAKLGIVSWNGGHKLLQTELSAAGVFSSHPEWFALVDGVRRSIPPNSGTYYNPSFVNAELANWFADRLVARLNSGDLADVDMLALWPSDGKIRGWDESPEARAYGNNTDTLLLFYARVADRLAQAHADGLLNRAVTISGITYNDTWELPLHTDIFPVLGMLDYVHIYYDPERSFGGALTDDLAWRDMDRLHMQRLAQWKALGTLPFGVTEYFNNSNYGAVPVLEHRSLLPDFQAQMQGGSLFAYMHPLNAKPGPRKLTNWLMAQLAWRGTGATSQEVEDWTADYFARRYGAAAAEMRSIYDLLDTAASNAREVFLRASLRHLLFIQQRSAPNVWTPTQVSDLANLYLAGGHQQIPAPGATSSTDLVSADFVGVTQSLALLTEARSRINAIVGLPKDQQARVTEDKLWAGSAFQRYDLLRVAIMYYREVNHLTTSSAMQAHHDKIVFYNSSLDGSTVMHDLLTPNVDQSDNLYPPEWLVVP